MASRPDRISVENYLAMLKHLPHGINEFVAHPGYVDGDLKRWSSYIEPRTRELQVLLDPRFRQGLASGDVKLMGYRDIATHPARAVKPVSRIGLRLFSRASHRVE